MVGNANEHLAYADSLELQCEPNTRLVRATTRLLNEDLNKGELIQIKFSQNGLLLLALLIKLIMRRSSS